MSEIPDAKTPQGKSVEGEIVTESGVKSRKSGKVTPIGCLITAIIVGLILACCCSMGNFPLFFSGEAVVTICDKDPKEGQYRVSASDGVTRQVYSVEDMHLPIVAWRTNAADTYYSLDKGKVYRITYRGFRWTPVSWFRNIETATPMPEVAPKGC